MARRPDRLRVLLAYISTGRAQRLANFICLHAEILSNGPFGVSAGGRLWGFGESWSKTRTASRQLLRRSVC
jgi:hypothetical protein